MPTDARLPVEHVDVLIVGAGVSGIGCAYDLQREQPRKSYAILEARDTTGGTWDLFRYPGIRSDSDLHTFGYEFKPWRDEKAIADGPSILRYIRETASENGIDAHIRLGHRVQRASWSSEAACWNVEATRADTGQTVRFSCGWLFCAGGYYSYDGGYMPHFEGRERFHGPIVHPQHWPEDLDYAGKRVVVIGSGATAMTLAPAMAGQAEHVTMLQRSPSYVVSVPERDPIANALKRVLPARTAYQLTRRKNIWLQRTIYELSRSRPRLVRRMLRAGARRQLPDGYPVDTHFNPRYDPWDQRLCAVPDGDLFKAIGRGHVSVVTDRIKTFTERGIELASGQQLEADVIVTATGLNLLALGGIELSVDGTAVELAQTMAYKAMMLSDVPNFAFAVGYTNASWTLKVDLVCEHLGRLLAYMDQHGYDSCTPHNDDPTVETRPLLDFAAGYVQRSVHEWPQQGSRLPWSLAMSYAQDVKNLRNDPVQDPALKFARRAPASRASAPAVLAA
ncbi:MAG TPA: NAD(P)/FAD-dependent oxidoreductase [Solirubrobacteraceae bacterium]|nr:NAD(P)/FAD-dependent oxidoreductase [Solirubrobacteraceae bacterium]